MLEGEVSFNQHVVNLLRKFTFQYLAKGYKSKRKVPAVSKARP